MTEKTNFIQKNDDQRMSSLEIAEITGKPHNDLMKAIRKMEVAWHNVNQGKFSLVTYTDAKVTIINTHHGQRESVTTKVTGKGQQYFMNIFINN